MAALKLILRRGSSRQQLDDLPAHVLSMLALDHLYRVAHERWAKDGGLLARERTTPSIDGPDPWDSGFVTASSA